MAKSIVSYSDKWYRPVDTPAGKAGWYVDKITTEWQNSFANTIKVESIPFPSEEEAYKFARRYGGLEVSECQTQ